MRSISDHYQGRNNDRNRMEHLRRNDTKDFLWTLGPDATHQITQSEHRTDLDKIKIEKLIKLYNR